MSLTLGRQGGIAQPLKKRTVGQTNIAHIYDGANHIWPTSVIHFSDFTSVQLRYIWGSDDGRDLDTKSYYVNSPINSLNYIAVGWSWNSSHIPYLYWGGDNTDSGAECVMFNIESMIDLEDNMPDIMKMNLCANWYGSLSRGHVTVECTAYKGGVIVHAWQLKNNEIDVDNIRFGFVAGNSEFRGQQTIQCYVGTQGGKADDGKTSIGEIKYTKLNKIGELTIYSPIES